MQAETGTGRIVAEWPDGRTYDYATLAARLSALLRSGEMLYCVLARLNILRWLDCGMEKAFAKARNSAKLPLLVILYYGIMTLGVERSKLPGFNGFVLVDSGVIQL